MQNKILIYNKKFEKFEIIEKSKKFKLDNKKNI